jgi:two-component system, response regulator PdtaR
MTKEHKLTRVLIIEDGAFIALLLKEFLNKWGGYEIIDIVSEGERAIEVSKELNPDLLLVDIHLEGDLSGIEVVRRIKKNQNVPVLYITADLSDVVITPSLLTEPSGYLNKPFKKIN